MTHRRLSDGRYCVRLPFKSDPGNLGDSLTPAIKMMPVMERRFAKVPTFHTNYKRFIKEYLDLDHMEAVVFENSKPNFYLPHHGVLKETSTTTPLRVVFNGSQKTEKGHSINEFQHIGPKLLPDLSVILLQWRLYPIVFSADIEKMFRQILIAPEDRDIQRIVWRDSEDEPLQHYRLKTVTYGLTSAPFLAIRTIHQLAEDEAESFPLGAKILKSEVYMDDILSGAYSLTDAIQKRTEIRSLLKLGGFPLGKWSSNSSPLYENLSAEEIAEPSIIAFQGEPTFQTLGLSCQPSSDQFLFSAKCSVNQKLPTKRTVLSRIAQLFDPLGWITPVILVAKIQIQSLWLLKFDWDEELPVQETTKWHKFEADLMTISQFKLPRWVGTTNDSDLEIHGFSDASEKAYGAAVYLKSIITASAQVHLLMVKSKVAPIKQQPLPRLELCAAHLLVKLTEYVTSQLNLEVSISLWTNSMVTLNWIRSHPSR